MLRAKILTEYMIRALGEWKLKITEHYVPGYQQAMVLT